MAEDLSILQLNSMYGPVCEEDIKVKELTPGIPLFDKVDLGEFIYFKLSLQGNKCLLTIQ